MVPALSWLLCLWLLNKWPVDCGPFSVESTHVLTRQFDALDSLLTATRPYWQVLPFALRALPWQDNPSLTAALGELADGDIEQLDGDDQALQAFLAPHIPALASLPELLSLPLSAARVAEPPSRFKAGIKGRKWQQLQAFAAMVPAGDEPVLEWCAGKGHLGRLIAHQQQRPVQSVEWQQHLCDKGQQQARQWQLDQDFFQADVLKGEADHLVRAEQQVVALHACGELHLSLLRQVNAAGSRKLLLSPCCYHLIGDSHYQPLSARGGESVLRLSKRDLNLPLQQTVVAGARERRFRAIEVAWRLGFDLLQREVRRQDSYLPLPSVRQSMLTGDFESFARWGAERKGLTLPETLDWQGFETAGWQRRHTNARIELVCHGFRQALEMWLLLDRALYLEEQGYQVSLSRFCDKSVTPRNLVISAQRPDQGVSSRR